MRTFLTPGRARAGRVLGLVVVAVVPLGLVGCSGDRVGTAAVIDGRPVEIRELQSAARAHLKVVPDADPGAAQRAILQQRIVSAAIDAAARAVGVRVPAGELAAERRQVLESVGGRKELIRALAQNQPPAVLGPQDVDRWLRDRLLFRAIAEEKAGVELTAESPEAAEAVEATNEELRTASRGIEVEISPRYGTWDPDEGISPLVSGGLSSTARELDGGS